MAACRRARPSSSRSSGSWASPCRRPSSTSRVPPAVVQQLAPVPPGYGYVRVDNDVLLMDMTNRMVADVVNDLDDYDSLGLD